MTSPAPFGSGGFTITRVFEAPRERVWREWTEPDGFADWFGGVECDVPLASVSMDVRPGGALRATMFCGPARREIRWTGEYREVVVPERLVFTISAHPRGEPFELVSVILTELGDGQTHMHFEQRGHQRPEEYDHTKRGWDVFFARLDERIAASP
jgi:uncharacterized protein YndB with AHSA1/START domain